MVKGFVLGVLTTLLFLVGGGFVYLRSGLTEVRADMPPSDLENYLMQTAIHASIQRNAPALRSPVPPSDVNLITGGKMYLDQCASCHGVPGAARNSEDQNGAPQFPGAATEYTESQVFWVARHGIRRTGMVSNYRDSDEEIWALAAYIKRMNKLPQHVKEELAKASMPAQ
jgi:mono/diheme cytochrome c family protein